MEKLDSKSPSSRVFSENTEINTPKDYNNLSSILENNIYDEKREKNIVLIFVGLMNKNDDLIDRVKNNMDILSCSHIELMDEESIYKNLDDNLFINNNTNKIIYVVDNFESNIFEYIKQKKRCILGYWCILAFLNGLITIDSFKFNNIYCLSLSKSVIVFSGFEKERKCELSYLTKLAHYMGARVKLEINNSVTHLVACDVKSSLYEDAIALGINVVNIDWLKYCWLRRDEIGFNGGEKEIAKIYRLKPFTGLCIAFHSFASGELKHMEEVALSNGATITDVSNFAVTHIVVDETINSDLNFCRENLWIVSSQWFWKSVQFQVNYSERFYAVPNFEIKKKIKPKNNEVISPNIKCISPKQKKSPLANLFKLKRDSANSSSNSITTNNDKHASKHNDQKILSINPISSNNTKNNKRTHTFMELVETEKNYVEILHILLDLFKDRLDKHLNDEIGPLMTREDIKIIFGAIPDIKNAHEQLYYDLLEILKNWNVDTKIGNIFENYIDSFTKSYPSFINYFEIIKGRVEKLDAENERFHAFLKCCLSEKRCNRQSLSELLIRPVQRLPSIILILKELYKQTPPEHDDRAHIQKAINTLSLVLNQINEDKKRTDEQLQMVQIYNNIEDCPPFVMSANRNFLYKFDALEFHQSTKHKAQSVTLFIMSDSIEFTKKRSSRFFKQNPNALIRSSPNVSSLSRNRSFKHCYFVPFNRIDNIIQVPNDSSSHWSNTFGLSMRIGETDEYSTTLFYQLIGNESCENFNKTIKHLESNIACSRTIYDVVSVSNNNVNESINLPFKKPDNSPFSIGKAIENFAFKATRRVSRAFSINSRTNGLPRSISVTSQISNESVSSFNKIIFKPRKSIQTSNTPDTASFISNDFENNPNQSNINHSTTDTKNTKNNKVTSIWRRSIQSSDFKR